MKIKFPKSKKKFKKGGIRLNPAVYWELSLCVGFIIIVISAFFGFYLFMEVNRGFANAPSVPLQAHPLNKERIERALDYFSDREKKSSEILLMPSPLVDPSS